MSDSDLMSLLGKIRDNIAQKAYLNETAVRSMILQCILQALGWDVSAPGHVCHEYPLKFGTNTRHVDVALCVSNGNPRCVVELKSPDFALKQVGESKADQQLFEYCFHAGAPLALLTNGDSWRFYCPQKSGTYADRLVRSFDIATDSLDKVVEWLQRYLSYSNTKSGKAAKFASDDLNKRLVQVRTRNAIRDAWKQLVAGNKDDRLMHLLTKATREFADRRPIKEDVTAFLKSLTLPNHIPWPEPARESEPVSRSPAPREHSNICYWLFGRELSAKTPKKHMFQSLQPSLSVIPISCLDCVNKRK